jgi:hypothetical protein
MLRVSPISTVSTKPTPSGAFWLLFHQFDLFIPPRLDTQDRSVLQLP